MVAYAEKMGIAYNELFTKKVRILNDLANNGKVSLIKSLLILLSQRPQNMKKKWVKLTI